KQQDGIGALAVAEDLQHAVHLGVAAEHGRNLVVPSELVQVRGEVLEERRQFEALLQPFLTQFVVAPARSQPGADRLRLDAVAANDRYGNPLRLLENRGKQVGGLDRVAAAAARVQQRQFEQQLRRRRDAKLTARDARQQPEVLFECLQDFVRVQLEIAHYLAEHVPFGLRKRET